MKIALTLISCLLAACTSLPSDRRNSLVGEWRYADNVQSCRYLFKKDGTFAGEVHREGKLLFKFRGTWTLQEDLLSYRYISDEMGGIPPGATDRDKLLSVEKNSFLIQAADGNRRRYSRTR